MTCERLITAFGETKSVSDWNRDARCTVSYKTLYARLAYLGWLVEPAITTPCLRLPSGYLRPDVVAADEDVLRRHLRLAAIDPGF